MNNLETISKGIQEFARRHNEVLAVYLFGSALTRDRPRDLDIALVIRRTEQGAGQSAYGYRAAVTAELMQLLGKNEIDVVLLHEASPLLSKEILRKGSLLYAGSGYDRIGMEKQMMDRYLDTAPLRTIKQRYLRNRYLGHD